MSKIIVFGTGDVAQLAGFYFKTDSVHEVVCFTVDGGFMNGKVNFEGKPLFAFEEIQKTHPPAEFKMFIALGYSNMNMLRRQKYLEAKSKGYELVSYVSSRCSWLSQVPPGDNCFILEDNTIQPFARIGSNVTLWSGNHLGHHSAIEDHAFISSHVVISGRCKIGENCFLGVNSTIGNGVTLAPETLVGAGAVVTKDSVVKEVYVPARSVVLHEKSPDVKL